MKKLNDNIKVIGIEAIAGGMLLLVNSRNNNRACLTMSYDGDTSPAYPMGEVILIDQATTFNAFEGFKTDQESEAVKLILTRMLSDADIEVVNRLLIDIQ